MLGKAQNYAHKQRLRCFCGLALGGYMLAGGLQARAQPESDDHEPQAKTEDYEAQAKPQEQDSSESLRVGFAGSAPFVQGLEHPEGLSIDVWRIVAEHAQLEYDLVGMDSVTNALDAVQAGELDVAIGPISITSERARKVHFTQPYFRSQLGILAAPGATGAWGRIAPFFTRVFASTSLALLLVLLTVGVLIWWLERRSNPQQFPKQATPGIGNGVWFALVTMTTVGYGDRAPVTRAGRALAGVWMLVALVTTSSLTAGLASAFTVLQLDTASIRDASELRGQRVAVVEGTTGKAFAAKHGATLVTQSNFDAAMEALERGDVVAAVHDKPMLQYYLTQTPDSSLRLLGSAYAPQSYGFALAGTLPDLRKFNIALLSAQESGEIRRVTRAWLGVLPE